MDIHIQAQVYAGLINALKMLGIKFIAIATFVLLLQ